MQLRRQFGIDERGGGPPSRPLVVAISRRRFFQSLAAATLAGCARKSLGIGLITQSGGRGGSSPPSVTPFFGDDFSSYTIGTSLTNNVPPVHQGNARWSGVDGSSGSTSVTVQTTPSGAKGLRFRYVAGGHWAEERQVYDSTGVLQIREMWRRFRLYIPPNWTYESQTNNKILFIYNDDTGNTAFCDHEMWRIDDGPFTGGAYLDMQIKIDGVNKDWINWPGAPHTTTFNWQASPARLGKDTPFIHPVNDLGQWLDLQFYAKMSSGPGVADAINRVWKNGVKILDVTNWVNWNTGNNGSGYPNQHWSGAYLLGYHNSGYTNQTDYFVENFLGYTQDPIWGLS